MGSSYLTFWSSSFFNVLSRGILLIENVIYIPDIWLAGKTSKQNSHDAFDCNKEKNK